MWLRYLIIASGIVLMIGGCNGLLSQLFGTHKLRHFTIDTLRTTGLGDADYVSIDSAHSPGDFVVGPAIHPTDRDIVIFPLISEAERADMEQGKRIRPALLAWNKVSPEVQEGRDSIRIPLGTGTIRGLVRAPNKLKNTSDRLSEQGYDIPKDVYYLEADRAPLAWYWNLLMLIGGIGIALAAEARAARRRQLKSK